MAIKGLNKVLNNLQNIKRTINNDIDVLFIDLSLEWIKEKANSNLDKRTQHFWGSDARNWTKNIYKTYGILENQDMNSASIEFGIGRKGNISGAIQDVARKEGWEYDVPTTYKDNNGRWSFQDVRTGIWVNGFSGYEGKSFLYDAFIEYMQNRVWVSLYQKAFDMTIRGAIK